VGAAQEALGEGQLGEVQGDDTTATP
jgi:hypothetical protein